MLAPTLCPAPTGRGGKRPLTLPSPPLPRGRGGKRGNVSTCEPGEGPKVLPPTLRPAAAGEGEKAPPHPTLSPAPAGARDDTCLSLTHAGTHPLAPHSGERVASAASRVRGQRCCPRPCAPHQRERGKAPPHPALSPAAAGARALHLGDGGGPGPLPRCRGGEGASAEMYRPASRIGGARHEVCAPCAGTRRAPVRSEECHGVSPVHRADGCRASRLPVCGGTATDSTANRVVHGGRRRDTRRARGARGQIRLGDPRPGDARHSSEPATRLEPSPPTSKPRDRGHVDTARTHLDLPRILPHSEPLGRCDLHAATPGLRESFGLARRLSRVAATRLFERAAAR